MSGHILYKLSEVGIYGRPPEGTIAACYKFMAPTRMAHFASLKLVLRKFRVDGQTGADKIEEEIVHPPSSR